MTVSLDQQIKCLKNELKRREKTFPRLVKDGCFSEEWATHQIECMRAAYQTMSQLRGMLSDKGDQSTRRASEK